MGEGVGAPIPPDDCAVVGTGAGVAAVVGVATEVAVAAGVLVGVATGVAVADSPHAAKAATPRDANISHRREFIVLSS